MKRNIPIEWQEERDWWWYLRQTATFPFRMLAEITDLAVGLLARMWYARPPGVLIQGIPALLAALALIGLVYTLARADPVRREAEYLAHARHCLQSGQYDAAMTSYERLLQWDNRRPEYLYGVALAANARGQVNRAVAIMKELAPEHRSGYGPAHFWLARSLLLQPPITPDRALRIERHLIRALGKQEDLVEAHVLLAQLYVNTDRQELAEPHLLRAVRVRPDLRLTLARTYRALGRADLAQVHARSALDFYRQESQANVDNRAALLGWSEAAVMLGDFPQAVRVLRHGLGLNSAPAYRRALAEVYRLWSDTLADAALTQFGKRLALIEQGLQADASNLGLLQRLLALTRPPRSEVLSGLGASAVALGAAPLGSGPMHSASASVLLVRRSSYAAQARAALENLLARGEVPAVAHLALGDDAWQRGKVQEARAHWEQAYRIDPSMALVVNNLAWVQAHLEPVDLPRALQLSQSLVERFPSELVYRGTRGHVLARMKRWKEAEPDLVASLKVYPNDPDLHRVLAEVYEHLGLPNMAAKHKQRAGEK